MADAEHLRRLDRARAALHGLALGDALGMPLQELPLARATELLAGHTGAVLLAGPPDHPFAAGLPAGRITDDTEQALLLAGLLVRHQGPPPAREWGQTLLDWQNAAIAGGVGDLLGPSTMAALSALRNGVDPSLTGRRGTTNGAAMRIAAAGIAYPCKPLESLEALVRAVVACDRVTHDTTVAHAGAAAVAAAVSAGIGGASVPEALALGARAAALGELHGAPVPGPRLAPRLRWVQRVFSGVSSDAEVGPAAAKAARGVLLERLVAKIGTSVAAVETVPVAFACGAAFPDDPLAAIWAAATFGGDADTIAAITGAVVGSCSGMSALPQDLLEVIGNVNRAVFSATARTCAPQFDETTGDDPIDVVARALLALRQPGSRS